MLKVTQLFNDVTIKTKVYLIPKLVMSGCIDSQWIGITGRHTLGGRREVPSLQGSEYLDDFYP